MAAPLACNLTRSGRKSCFSQPDLYTKFYVVSFNGCRNKYGAPNFYMLPQLRRALFRALNVILVSYCPYQNCVKMFSRMCINDDENSVLPATNY